MSSHSGPGESRSSSRNGPASDHHSNGDSAPMLAGAKFQLLHESVHEARPSGEMDSEIRALSLAERTADIASSHVPMEDLAQSPPPYAIAASGDQPIEEVYDKADDVLSERISCSNSGAERAVPTPDSLSAQHTTSTNGVDAAADHEGHLAVIGSELESAVQLAVCVRAVTIVLICIPLSPRCWHQCN